MILCDFSQMAISSIFASGFKFDEVDDNVFKHCVFNSIRSINLKFSGTYGEIVICCDSKNYWRKDIFPYYKQNRKTKDLDPKWRMIYGTMAEIKNDLREYFPYKVIEVERAEADDIIAVLSRIPGRRHLIVSKDGDFNQLLNDNVQQWSTLQKAFLKEDKDGLKIFEKIIKGDSGDGIPNVLSDDDVFVNPNKRQKPVMSKNLSSYLQDYELNGSISGIDQTKLDRNKKLILFDQIPQECVNKIEEAYTTTPILGNKMKLIEYFSKNKMRVLSESITEF